MISSNSIPMRCSTCSRCSTELGLSKLNSLYEAFNPNYMEHVEHVEHVNIGKPKNTRNSQWKRVTPSTPETCQLGVNLRLPCPTPAAFSSHGDASIGLCIPSTSPLTIDTNSSYVGESPATVRHPSWPDLTTPAVTSDAAGICRLRGGRRPPPAKKSERAGSKAVLAPFDTRPIPDFDHTNRVLICGVPSVVPLRASREFTSERGGVKTWLESPDKRNSLQGIYGLHPERRSIVVHELADEDIRAKRDGWNLAYPVGMTFETILTGRVRTISGAFIDAGKLFVNVELLEPARFEALNRYDPVIDPLALPVTTLTPVEPATEVPTDG